MRRLPWPTTATVRLAASGNQTQGPGLALSQPDVVMRATGELERRGGERRETKGKVSLAELGVESTNEAVACSRNSKVWFWQTQK